VGIPSVAPEPLAVRVRRAVGVACDDLPFASGTHAGADGTIEVTAATAYRVGIVAARLQVALWGEGLLAHLDDETFAGTAGEPRALITITET
jgi:hypothetical protein